MWRSDCFGSSRIVGESMRLNVSINLAVSSWLGLLEPAKALVDSFFFSLGESLSLSLSDALDDDLAREKSFLIVFGVLNALCFSVVFAAGSSFFFSCSSFWAACC
jgi:hypothetical protein